MCNSLRDPTEFPELCRLMTGSLSNDGIKFIIVLLAPLVKKSPPISRKSQYVFHRFAAASENACRRVRMRESDCYADNHFLVLRYA